MTRSGAVAAGVLLAWVTAWGQTPLATVLVDNGFDQPIYLTHAPGDLTRLFVLEKEGRIRVIKNGSLLTTPFLNISGPVNATGFETGLLGLAFSPSYQSNGHFYVCWIGPEPQHNTMVQRYTVSANPDVASSGSAVNVLTIDRTAYDDCHNGGWLGFGPDGYLYVSTGDSMCACDTANNAQNLNSLLGKILRINVNTLPYTIPVTNPFAAGGGRPEIWAYGLRNPWRPGFDRQTGDLWIADVGEETWEEVNVQPAAGGGVATARNYGWRCREGPACSSVSPSNCNVTNCPPGCMSAGYTNPVHSYAQSPSICSITGGYVYRGCAIPDLKGTYFYADFCSEKIWSFRYSNGQVTQLTDRTQELQPIGGQTIHVITSFGEDALGEIYICDFADGEVYRIIPEVFVGPDCNNNGVRDECDIAAGTSPDLNGNGVPDECDCYPNCNNSFQGATPTLSVADFACFQARYVAGAPYADCNQSGSLTIADFSCFQARFTQGCP